MCEGLRAEIGRLELMEMQRLMFIKGDGKLDFSAVAQVVDIAKGAGATNIGLITPKSGM
jgi:biopolymer transport protein ExbD